ncbi:MAG: hypothetical protein GXP27_14245, partial [Planctomycetes bacterium]|nr:hypothetical protein [Planctomycetota bacterium]
MSGHRRIWFRRPGTKRACVLTAALAIAVLAGSPLRENIRAAESQPSASAAESKSETPKPGASAKPAVEKPAAETQAKPETKPSAQPAAKPTAPTSKPERTPAATPTPKPASASPQGEEPTQRKLRFNFRYQRWVDVLEWFAQQADLSLVMDAPPPGTFNYSDTREYTPTEAIDLLNSVLLPKGFTLIRRERMLRLVDLRKGYPEGVIPRISLDELDKRGQYELVSVLFPLQGRKPEDVAKEVTPLLGPYGKCVPLPQTNQVLVTDRAGLIKTIAKVIESMPVPK